MNLSVSAMHGYSTSDKISEMYNETDTFACGQNILVYIQKRGGYIRRNDYNKAQS